MNDPRYFLEEQSQIPPRFEGKAAARLGMEWSETAYLNLFDGYTTKDGERDRKLPKYMHPQRRGAIAITFSLPKCGSILKELGGDSRIGDVMTKAREAAMAEVERQYYVKHPYEQPGELVHSTFRHGGSREGDPHAHDHTVIYNLSPTMKKGREVWKAIEMRYLDYKGIAKIHSDTQIKGLNQLGYKIKRVGSEFEIVGVPAEIKGEFSRRKTAIVARKDEMEQKTGKPMSSKAKSKLSVYDRPDKPPDMPHEERRKGWLARIADHQHDHLKALVHSARQAVSFERWKSRIKQHAIHIRQSMVMEKEIERGISR